MSVNLSEILGHQFDAGEIETNTGEYELIPEGYYVASIIDSEERTTKDGQGKYISLCLEILEGKFKTRRIWPKLNIKNNNPKSVQISMADLASICKATGVMCPTNTQELHEIPIVVKVKISPPKNGYEASNDISTYIAADASGAQKAQDTDAANVSGSGAQKAPFTQQAPTQQAASAPAAGQAPPWSK